MIGRILRPLGLPAGGLELMLAAGGAYFAWEHGQGRHDQPHLLCLICWLNKIAASPTTADGTSHAEPQDQHQNG